MAGRRRRRRTHRGRWLIALIVLALVAAVAGYQVYERNARTRQRLAFDCATLTRLTASTAAERAALAEHSSGPTAVFLGDSYTQGVGLPYIGDDYAYVAADALHWRAVLNAAGGTGYVSGGPCHGQQLLARVPQVVSAHPAVVVIQAGLDDYQSHEQRIERAAEQVYAQLRHDLPNTSVVVVGPHSVPKVSDVRPVIDALRTATTKAHVTYIDASSWPLLFEKDGIHLTVAGHRIYGQHLALAMPDSLRR
jgi:lysophospholipase L1-like esterase